MRSNRVFWASQFLFVLTSALPVPHDAVLPVHAQVSTPSDGSTAPGHVSSSVSVSEQGVSAEQAQKRTPRDYGYVPTGHLVAALHARQKPSGDDFIGTGDHELNIDHLYRREATKKGYGSKRDAEPLDERSQYNRLANDDEDPAVPDDTDTVYGEHDEDLELNTVTTRDMKRPRPRRRHTRISDTDNTFLKPRGKKLFGHKKRDDDEAIQIDARDSKLKGHKRDSSAYGPGRFLKRLISTLSERNGSTKDAEVHDTSGKTGSRDHLYQEAHNELSPLSEPDVAPPQSVAHDEREIGDRISSSSISNSFIEQRAPTKKGFGQKRDFARPLHDQINARDNMQRGHKRRRIDEGNRFVISDEPILRNEIPIQVDDDSQTGGPLERRDKKTGVTMWRRGSRGGTKGGYK